MLAVTARVLVRARVRGGGSRPASREALRLDLAATHECSGAGQETARSWLEAGGSGTPPTPHPCGWALRDVTRCLPSTPFPSAGGIEAARCSFKIRAPSARQAHLGIAGKRCIANRSPHLAPARALPRRRTSARAAALPLQLQQARTALRAAACCSRLGAVLQLAAASLRFAAEVVRRGPTPLQLLGWFNRQSVGITVFL